MVAFDTVFSAEVATAISAARAANEWDDEPVWFVPSTRSLTTPFGLDQRSLRRGLQACITAEATALRIQDLDVTRRCVACGDPNHGPPVVTVGDRAIHLSSSSVGDAFVFVVGSDTYGLDLMSTNSLSAADIERARRATDGTWSVIENLGVSPEATWTGLEALAKTTGLGLAADVGQIDAALSQHDLRWYEPDQGLLMAIASPAGTRVRPFAVLDLDRGPEVAERSLTPVAVRLVESAR